MSAVRLPEPHAERLRAALGIGVETISESTGGFRIDRADTLHIVLDGSIDVFAAELARDTDEPVGARRHLFRLKAGSAMVGLLRQRGRFGILAVPAPGVQYAPIAFDGVAVQQAGKGALVAAFTEFILAVGDGLITELPPRLYRPLPTGESGTFAPGTVLSGVERSCWLRLKAGALQLFGRPDLRFDASEGERLIPFGSRAWAVVTEEATLDAEPFDSEATRLLPALAAWLDSMLDIAGADITASTAREAERLTRKAAKATAIMQRALERFVAVGLTEVPAETRVDEGDGEAATAGLMSACRLVGKAAGVELVAPPQAGERQGLALAEEIAAASKVRCRRVMLREGWWQGDNGPLLGFLAAESDDAKKPVALLPQGKRYVMHVPASGEIIPVSDEVASRIDTFALSFYRVLPPRSLSAKDLVRFGAFGQGRDLSFALLGGALIGLLGMATPIVTGRLIDTVIPSADKTDVLALTAILVAASIASTLFGLARAISVLRVEGKMDSALQAAIWDRVLGLPAHFFRQFAAGDLALRINGINTIRKALSGAVMSTLLSSVFSLFNIVLLFYYSAKLAFAAMGLIAVCVAVSGALGYLKVRCERDIAAISGKISGIVYQYLTGIAKLRVAAAEGRAFANWAAQYTRLRGLTIRTTWLSNIEMTFFGGFGVLVNAVIFGLIGMVLFKDDAAALSTGAFVAFNSALGTVFGGILEMSQTMLGMLNLVPVYERTQPILQTPPEVDTSKLVLTEVSGEIEVQKMSFAYGDGVPVLREVSFSIRSGEFVAIVGPSGSGKSTLLRLLMGFEQPNAGSICYDSHNLIDLDVHALRRQLGVVLQSGQLMAGDIFNNIAGTSGATLDEVMDAARLCGLEEDINNMPMGLHTVIGEGSSTLSGGQRQRILIARAIVAKPRILFFDEATSALDNRTQAVVSESLERLKATRIVIAHRLSTVVKADRIFVLEDGRLVQSGRYEELLAQPGLFAELAKRQIA